MSPLAIQNVFRFDAATKRLAVEYSISIMFIRVKQPESACLHSRSSFITNFSQQRFTTALVVVLRDSQNTFASAKTAISRSDSLQRRSPGGHIKYLCFHRNQNTYTFIYEKSTYKNHYSNFIYAQNLQNRFIYSFMWCIMKLII